VHKSNITEDTWLLRVPDAAARSGLGQHDLRRLVASGEVKAIRRKRTILIDMDDLKQWISEQAERAQAAV